MAQHWTAHAPARPDRYIDWALVNRAALGPVGDGWCSVLLQLEAAPGPDPAAHLKALRAQLPSPLQAGQPTINISADERALLSRRITQLEQQTYQPAGPDDAGLTFFVYMPESRIYDGNGTYAHTSVYRIRFAGPPIPGLRFDQHPPMRTLMTQHGRHGDRGQPVAIGIIDHAIAFAHERFRRQRPAGGARSRVMRLWLQHVERAGPDPADDVLFGRRLTDDDITDALAASAIPSGAFNEDAVYVATGAVSYEAGLRQATARRLGHGTHVMDLACGFAPDDDAGDDRPILAVQLPEAATLDTSGVTMASYVLQALRQIMLWADQPAIGGPLPLVVNFSYGIYAGPKDGTHLIEHEIERLVAHRNRLYPTLPTAVVVPAGNTYRGRVTAHMRLQPGSQQSIDWVVQPDGGTPSFLEIWLDGSGGAPLAVQVTPPGGSAGPATMPVAGQAQILSDGGRPVGAMYVDTVAGRAPGAAARCRITIAINPTKSYTRNQPIAPSGSWRISLHNTGGQPADAHLYIQREEVPPHEQPPGRQSFFDHDNAYLWDTDTANYEALGTSPAAPCPICHQASLSAFATHPARVVVGAAFAEKDQQPHAPALYTAAGPTAGRPAPDLAAITDEDRAYPGIPAAGTRSGSVVLLDGTSVAAPQVTRRLADADVDLAKLVASLGLGSGAPHPRLGRGVVPRAPRPDLPPRRRV